MDESELELVQCGVPVAAVSGGTAGTQARTGALSGRKFPVTVRAKGPPSVGMQQPACGWPGAVTGRATAAVVSPVKRRTYVKPKGAQGKSVSFALPPSDTPASGKAGPPQKRKALELTGAVSAAPAAHHSDGDGGTTASVDEFAFMDSDGVDSASKRA